MGKSVEKTDADRDIDRKVKEELNGFKFYRVWTVWVCIGVGCVLAICNFLMQSLFMRIMK